MKWGEKENIVSKGPGVQRQKTEIYIKKGARRRWNMSAAVQIGAAFLGRSLREVDVWGNGPKSAAECGGPRTSSTRNKRNRVNQTWMHYSSKIDETKFCDLVSDRIIRDNVRRAHIQRSNVRYYCGPFMDTLTAANVQISEIRVIEKKSKIKA